MWSATVTRSPTSSRRTSLKACKCSCFMVVSMHSHSLSDPQTCTCALFGILFPFLIVLYMSRSAAAGPHESLVCWAGDGRWEFFFRLASGVQSVLHKAADLKYLCVFQNVSAVGPTAITSGKAAGHFCSAATGPRSTAQRLVLW